MDEALNRTLWLRFALGLFDPIADQPLWHVPPNVVGSATHTALARDATAQALVLLRNDLRGTAAASGLDAAATDLHQTSGGQQAGAATILPFAPGAVLAVIGPHANATQALLG